MYVQKALAADFVAKMSVLLAGQMENELMFCMYRLSKSSQCVHSQYREKVRQILYTAMGEKLRDCLKIVFLYSL